ncbi:hypothetical protein [Bianquea renquensis]|uniref:Uncharacterized protein n=1 Tax=Bianquea renquensis TaxID=2763661 RepID=A0A926DTH0_9FIRM|nr:hypothetical protein [Bianquea renquensis]MBC8543444.1 hypothetical protein [Bianquea renquensis]
MKGSGVIRYGLSGMLLAAVIATSIWLPWSMMQKAEDALVGRMYEESFNPADGGYKYSVTAEEKRRLFTYLGREGVALFSDPTEKTQLTLERALDACKRELDTWVELGILPEYFAHMKYEVSPQFLTIYDPDTPALSYDFWFFILYIYDFGEGNDEYDFLNFPNILVYLDGYTGAICDFSLYFDQPDWKFMGGEEWSIENAMKAFGEYHGVEIDKIGIQNIEYGDFTFVQYKATLRYEDVWILGNVVEDWGMHLGWALEEGG